MCSRILQLVFEWDPCVWLKCSLRCSSIRVVPQRERCPCYPFCSFFFPSSLGTFGDVRVTYTIQKADVATLATADGTPVLDYFSDQEPDISLSNSTLLSEPTVSSLDECARGCLSDEACLSFSSDSSSFCQLYLAVRTTETEISQPGAGYYVKDQNRVCINLIPSV